MSYPFDRAWFWIHILIDNDKSWLRKFFVQLSGFVVFSWFRLLVSRPLKQIFLPGLPLSPASLYRCTLWSWLGWHLLLLDDQHLLELNLGRNAVQVGVLRPELNFASLCPWLLLGALMLFAVNKYTIPKIFQSIAATDAGNWKILLQSCCSGAACPYLRFRNFNIYKLWKSETKCRHFRSRTRKALL